MGNSSGTTKAVLILSAIGVGIVLLIYAYPLVISGLLIYLTWVLIKTTQSKKIIATVAISILALVWFGYFVGSKNKSEVAGVETKQETNIEKKTTLIPSPSTTPSPIPSPASTIQETAVPQTTIQTNSIIKKSGTGICHTPGTTYYEKTKDYTSYNSIDECLASGGRLPKQ